MLHLPPINCSDPDLSEAKTCCGVGNGALKCLNVSGISKDDKNVPAKQWEFFEGQLKLNVNFRICRLHLMQYKEENFSTQIPVYW